jgi:carbonic anhydrase
VIRNVGITRLQGSRDPLAACFAVDTERLRAKAINGPPAAVAVDVAALKADPSLSGGIVVSGLVYDIATGLIETVVAPSPLRT